MASPIEIGYWKIRGLAAPLRMMAVYSGVAYKDNSYDVLGGPGKWDYSQWASVKPSLAEKNPLINLPYVKDGETIVTQSNACLLYLARKFNLLGKTPEETTRTEQILFQSFDLRNDKIAVVYEYPGSDINKFFTESVPEHFGKFENWFKHNGTPFCAGNEPTLGDFPLWEIVDQVHRFQIKENKDTFGNYPLLKAYHERFRALPQLAAYFQSPQASYVINNYMAIFL